MITITIRLCAETLSIYFSTYTNRREVALSFIDDEDTKSIDYTSHNQKRKTGGNSGEKEGRVYMYYASVLYMQTVNPRALSRRRCALVFYDR